MSLVVLAHTGPGDISRLLAQVPDCIEEVILAAPPQGQAASAPLARSVPRVRSVEYGGGDDGEVVHAGLLAASGDYIVLINADGSMSPKEIPHYLHYLESGYDFVKGSRFIAGGGSAGYPLARRLGHSFLLHVARALYGQRLTDLWFGFCAFRRGYLELLDLHTDGAELGAQIVVHALHFGLRIAEVPSQELPRREETLHVSTFRDGARILGTLLDERPRSALLRLVLAPQR